MNIRAVEMLEAAMPTEHTVMCWFDFDGKRYAAYYQDPPSCSVARELLMQRAEWTMELLEDIAKTKPDMYGRRTINNISTEAWTTKYAGREFFAVLPRAPAESKRMWQHPTMLTWPESP
jgi:hypothetical protein